MCRGIDIVVTMVVMITKCTKMGPVKSKIITSQIQHYYFITGQDGYYVRNLSNVFSIRRKIIFF